ncbi:MAG: DNA topoisomerase, partial [Candidatus Pacearchaeota archaeon]
MPRTNKKNDFGVIPIDPRNVKKIVEVPVKEIKGIEKIENPGIISSEKLLRRKKGIKKIKERKKENIEKLIKEKNKEKYILVITEKPQAAEKIASALGVARKVSVADVPYFEVSRDGEKIVVAAAAGHLFTLAQKTRGQVPVFDLEWKPSFEKKANFTKKFYEVLRKLAKNAKDFVVATDYDIEGEVIGWNILRFICNKEDAKRMKYSTLTSFELNQAYENLMPSLDWGQAIAGETRHYLDWMYGINLSRALMEAIKKAGSFRIMSIGRVQGPALRLVVDKEIEIQNFKPKPFWQIFIEVNGVRLKHIKDITDKKGIEKFRDLKGKIASLKTSVVEESIMPPVPFDLTTLQIEAYKFFKITPARTLQIAQQLYLSGLISYPRTSSQKIPESINPQKILSKLADN